MPASGLRSHIEGTRALFNFMTENWEQLVTKLPPSSTMLGSMVQICTATFTTQADLDRVEAFFKDKSTKGFEMPLAQSLDAIRSKISWLARDREDVKHWVEEYTKKELRASCRAVD